MVTSDDCVPVRECLHYCEAFMPQSTFKAAGDSNVDIERIERKALVPCILLNGDMVALSGTATIAFPLA